MKARGWANASQLARNAALTYPVAARVLQGAELERIEVATLEALCLAFDCEPWDVLEYKR